VRISELHDGWTVRAVGGALPDAIAGLAIPAVVPGCVHLDLMAAGLIPDPYLGQNEEAVAWVGAVDWRYERTLWWDGSASNEHVDLVADGLDTVATIELNDTVVAHTANMHRSYRFPVARLLQPGENRLAITFAAGIAAAERASAELGPRPYISAHPFNALRKMACNFGWDWGPDLVTAGIWRSLRLETWARARIASVRPLVSVDGTTGRLTTHVDIEGDQSLPVTVVVGGHSGSSIIEVPDVRLWWPVGEGEQALYDVTVTLGDGVDEWRGRVGFRTVELDTSDDEHGTRFVLSVNGRALFARGVNWIPDDCFPSRVTRARYAERLTQARDMNVNVVRVWGGGIYESDDFYAACDELGLLVWQDFPFACAAYAEEEPLRSEVVAEARDAVARLSPHPSLAIWNGCNENIWGHDEWGWRDDLGDRTWGWGYYTDVLPSIVAELDPTRPYSPGSPFSFRPDTSPNDPAHGTMHIWDVWNERGYTAYRDYRPRFVAEFGFQGPPAWATLTRAVPASELRPDSTTMLAHQKADDGNGKLARGLESHLPAPENVDDWHWATSLNQARAMAFGVEHFRSIAPLCMGTLVWQLNDCWPVTSWAAIDGDGRRKPLWYALRRSFAPHLLTLQPRDGELALVAVNDSSDAWHDTVEVTHRCLDGSVVASVQVPLAIAPRSSTTVVLPAEVGNPHDPTREIVLAETGALRAWWHFAEDVDADYAPVSFDAKVDEADGGYRVTVVAHTLVRDLALLVDRAAADASVDDMLVTLLPGETATFAVQTAAALRPEQLTDPLVLRCANQLLSPGLD
jgi:beta-mannosidase